MELDSIKKMLTEQLKKSLVTAGKATGEVDKMDREHLLLAVAEEELKARTAGSAEAEIAEERRFYLQEKELEKRAAEQVSKIFIVHS